MVAGGVIRSISEILKKLKEVSVVIAAFGNSIWSGGRDIGDQPLYGVEEGILGTNHYMEWREGWCTYIRMYLCKYICTYIRTYMLTCTVCAYIIHMGKCVHAPNSPTFHSSFYWNIHIYNYNPTVHYTTAPSFTQFPHFVCNFIQSGCVRVSESDRFVPFHPP